MKIKIIHFDKFKEKEYTQIFDLFLKRIKNMVNVEVKELKEETNLATNNIEVCLLKESKEILKEITNNSYVYLLEIKGKQLDSIEFANHLQNNLNSGKKEIIFIIGSSYGVHNSIKQKSDFHLSFSKMTFGKQIFKIMFIEQLYRALTIINNINYHK